MARPAGSLNKRSKALLETLKSEYDLDPIMKLAETCSLQVPMTDTNGDPVVDANGNMVMVPFLKASELITALGKLADKTYPSLKAQEIDLGANSLPMITIDMKGIAEDTKKRGRKR